MPRAAVPIATTRILGVGHTTLASPARSAGRRKRGIAKWTWLQWPSPVRLRVARDRGPNLLYSHLNSSDTHSNSSSQCTFTFNDKNFDYSGSPDHNGTITSRRLQ